jgi:hypothetical protein
LVGWSDDRPDDPNFSFISVEGLDLIFVPEFDMFVTLGIVVDLAGSMALPEGEGFFQGLIVFLLEYDESAVAIGIEFAHPRPIGIEGVGDDGVEETSVGLVQAIQETVGGSEFAFVALVAGVGIAERLLVEYRLDGQYHIQLGTEQQGDDIAVVVQFHDLLIGASNFPRQAVRAVPSIGGEGLPTVDGHAPQGPVGTLAKNLIALGFLHHLFERAL